MLSTLFSAVLIHTAAFPAISHHEGVARIHSFEYMASRLPFTLGTVFPPVQTRNFAIVAADCSMANDPSKTFTLRMFTDRADESHIFCMTKDGRPLAELFFKVTPMGITGHELTVQTLCYRDPQRARILVRCISETIVRDLSDWRFDFKQNPQLKKYREFVLRDQ